MDWLRGSTYPVRFSELTARSRKAQSAAFSGSMLGTWRTATFERVVDRRRDGVESLLSRTAPTGGRYDAPSSERAEADVVATHGDRDLFGEVRDVAGLLDLRVLLVLPEVVIDDGSAARVELGWHKLVVEFAVLAQHPAVGTEGAVTVVAAGVTGRFERGEPLAGREGVADRDIPRRSFAEHVEVLDGAVGKAGPDREVPEVQVLVAVKRHVGRVHAAEPRRMQWLIGRRRREDVVTATASATGSQRTVTLSGPGCATTESNVTLPYESVLQSTERTSNRVGIVTLPPVRDEGALRNQLQPRHIIVAEHGEDHIAHPERLPWCDHAVVVLVVGANEYCACNGGASAG